MAPPSHTRLLILDCDGVLIRSEGANLAYYNELFRAFGLPRVATEDTSSRHKLHTLSTPQVVAAFFPEELQDAATKHLSSLHFEPFLEYVDPEPGWGEVLSAWKAFGPVAVATNRGSSAEAVLERVGLRGWIDHLVTIRDVARPKPHPEMLLRVLEWAEIPPLQAVYVGDSELDEAAARAAGIPFIGFRSEAIPSIEQPGQLLRAVAILAQQLAPGRLQAVPS